jgi:hypothetical protein
MLTLSPGALDDPLEGKLELVNIASPGSYESLSYVWGKLKQCHEIICASQRLGLTTRLRITTSLHDTLRWLKQPDQPRRLWTDQICINRDNMTEQVQYPRRCPTSKPPIQYVSAKSGIWPDSGSRREHATVLGTELEDLQNTYSLRANQSTLYSWHGIPDVKD